MSLSFHHLKKYLVAVIALCGAIVSSANAAPISGGYVPGGATTGTGPWTLTSTDSTFSTLRRNVNEIFTFADLTDLSVAFISPINNADIVNQALLNAGGGGGAPRLNVALDLNNDNVSDGSVQIHLGNSPSFADSPIVLTLNSGMNLIGNNDTGRYDLSQLGGSNFSDYNTALTNYGSGRVLRATVVLDSFGGADKTLFVDSVDGAFVPEPATVALTGIAAAGLGLFVTRRRRRR